uniref:Fasciclin domain-containing protein n=1 Tax=Caldilinea aerophila TaxID=133453 RepID=A0A7C1JCW4_9CHLR
MKQRIPTILQALVVLALILGLVPLRTFAQGGISEKPDVVETAVAAGNFTILVELIQAAELVDVLKGEGPFTVFAPTDEAFAAVPAEILTALAEDPEMLRSVLLYHVVPGRLVAALISDGKEVETAQGESVRFSFADGVKKVNEATIVARDIQASNGVIHAIDSIILPPSVAAALSDLLTAGAAEAPATPEPTEEAAEAATAEATATPEPVEEAAGELADIVDTAVAAGQFTTLAAALTEAGLVDALRGPGPFTVFAPTDDAFAALPQETLDAVLADPQGLLTQILLYHVVAGKVMAADLVDGQELATLQGAPLTISLSEEGAMVNDATIIATDIEASNGVIHVIDAVLVPPLEEAVAEAAAEATPAPTEEAVTEATPAPSEEEVSAPEMLPVTGGDNNFIGLVVAFAVLIAAGFALTLRRRLV